MIALKRYGMALLIILLLGGFPFIPATLAETIAAMNDCRLDEARAHPCVLGGYDAGGLLYGMNVFAWMGIGTVPIAIGLLCLLGAVAAIHAVLLAARAVKNRLS